ncbi:MAG: stage III sporulation protein AD [Lachnospiraceae bacterium]|nr:stage III sporulation protein AD [Lachnospiraceae bacterium]
MEIIKVGILGVVGVLIAIQFKSQKPEYSIYIGIGVCILIFCYALQYLSNVAAQLQILQRYMETGQEYLTALLKIVGITYICEFSAGICKDAGYQSVASQIEVLGKLTVMFAGLPILFAMIEQMEGFWR